MESEEKTQQQRIAALWQTLEQEHKAPQSTEIPYLSALTVEDAARLAQLWPRLPAAERRRLVASLVQLAEGDFSLDFAAIFRLALHDLDATVRASAIEGFWEDEDAQLIPQLTRFLLEDEAEEVRVMAAQCLGHFVLLGELEKIRPRPFEMACEALLAAHNNPQETLEVRRRALESLAYASLPAFPELLQTAYAHPAAPLRLSAVFAMGRSADPRWKETVIQELHNPDPAMRYEAARACGELAAAAALHELVELTEDVDSEVQEAALWALGQIGGELARGTLERHLHSTNEALQEAAGAALNELEFLHGDPTHFLGLPEDFVGESDTRWEELFMASDADEDWPEDEE